MLAGVLKPVRTAAPGSASEPRSIDRVRYQQLRRRSADALAKRLGARDPILECPEVTDAIRISTRELSFLDRTTIEHQWRTAELAGGLGARLGLDAAGLRMLVTASTLHDVGKLFVPTGLLNRPGPLTAEEHGVVRDHSAKGQQWLVDHRVPAPIPSIVRWHHERWDGMGYPDHLAGDEIPLEARILCLADALDAMLSQRPYHCGRSMEEVRRILAMESGHAFDPQVVEAVFGFWE